MVLLKGVDADGFRFFTNYESPKARQLDGARGARRWSSTGASSTARCACAGRSSGSRAAESDVYFATRPARAQLGAWASPQSAAARDRDELDPLVDEVEERFAGGEVPRPAALGRVPAAARSESSSGRARSAASTTASATRARASGWRIERLAP